MEWSKTNVWSTMHICWGAQAALSTTTRCPSTPYRKRSSVCFRHRVLDPNEPIMRGFDEVFLAPHSRHTEVRRSDIEAVRELKLLAVSARPGSTWRNRRTAAMMFVTGHPEYERFTLKAEYDRDGSRGLPIEVPKNYFPGDDLGAPLLTWRSHAHLLYSNWLNYCVYQATPFDLNRLPGTDTPLRLSALGAPGTLLPTVAPHSTGRCGVGWRMGRERRNVVGIRSRSARVP